MYFLFPKFALECLYNFILGCTIQLKGGVYKYNSC